MVGRVPIESSVNRRGENGHKRYATILLLFFNLIKIDRSDVMRGHEKQAYGWVYIFLFHVLYILAYTPEVSLDLT